MPALIRSSGAEPRIIEYLKTPPSRAELVDLPARAPILIDRPIVGTGPGVVLGRPAQTVLEILPHPQKKPFVEEDGTPVA